MCGIVGIIGSSRISPRLIQSLLNLEYRGYDSCGLAILNNGVIDVRKDTGPVHQVAEQLRFSEMDGCAGIGHTRWATTGTVTRANAHPHLDNSGEFALVHNGIIANYRALRQKLQHAGHRFLSETDTEVLVHLLAHKYAETGILDEAIRRMCRELEGTFALAVISNHEPDRIFAARHESPLIVGIGTGENYIGSDFNAILDYTRNVIPIHDGELVILSRDSVSIRRLDTGEKIQREFVKLNWDPELSQKGGYPHYMLKEIHEQPNTVEAALTMDPEKLEAMCIKIQNARRVYLIGVGTTFYVALTAQYYFRRLTGRHCIALSSDEFEHVAEVDEHTLVIAFSQSGETYDTLHALRYAKNAGSHTAAIINVLGSSMVHEVEMVIMQQSGPEICVLSTKAAIAQIVIALRLALEVGKATGELSTHAFNDHLEQLNKLSTRVRRVINETKGFVNTIARETKKIRNWLFIGRGIYSAVAMESALKMKEVTYHHAEGIPGGFMKHGTIALIEDGFGSIFFLPPQSEANLYHHSIANAEEIKSRHGFIVGFGFGEPSDLFDHQIRLDDYDPLTAPILLLVLGQLFSYYSAVVLKRNVDRPRSLAKSVTVA
ncbi:glutamine--fructose-6-phosphate transaminase (isomerizing) [bacterium]|nr:glutamine--fructose-6-phosphate transaminase (isomerizing) [candidate division CSSED10-310 bacterium]